MLSLNGPVYRVCTFLYHLLVMNLVYLVACLPLVTIPPATVALFAVVRKYVHGDEPPIWRTFWREFKDNWRRACVVSLAFGSTFIFIWIAGGIVAHQHFMFAEIALAFLGIVLLTAVAALMQVLPLMVHCELTVRRLLLNSLVFTLVKPYLTAANLLLLVFWFVVAEHNLALMLSLFFSSSAFVTYWIFEQKLKTIDWGRAYSTTRIAASDADTPRLRRDYTRASKS